MRKLVSLLAALACAYALDAVLHAQITVPFPTFIAGTVINPDEVNADFAKFQDALNRTGGGITGNITVTAGITIDGIDLSAVLGGTGTPTFATLTTTGLATLNSLGVTNGATVGTALLVLGPGAGALDVAGGINAGSGNVTVVGADGRMPAIDSVHFASLSGAALTGILETGIADGAILARVASAETISGAWTFTTSPAISNGSPSQVYIETGATAQEGRWLTYADGDSFQLITLTDASGFGSFVWQVDRVGVVPTGFTLTPRLNSIAAQPSFLVIKTANQAGVNAPATVTFDSERYDPTNSFDLTTEVFTAPVTGVYELCASIDISSGVAQAMAITLVTSGGSFVLDEDTGTAVMLGRCVPVDLAVGQTANINLTTGTTVTINGTVAPIQTTFSGRLLP